MTFPKISIKATNIELTTGLSTLIDQKFNALGKFIPEGATDATCRIEIEKHTEHQSGMMYRIEVTLFAYGKTYRVEATQGQVESAIDEARDELKRELEEEGDKRKTLIREGARQIKDAIRFGE